MLCQSRDGVFSAWVKLKHVISEVDLLKIFVLINKYYPSYNFLSDDFADEHKKWEDYILSNFEYRPNNINNINLGVSVFVQKSDNRVIEIISEDDGLELIYGTDDGIPILGIQFYHYVYFDENYVYLDDTDNILCKNKMVVVNQSIAAKKNRNILKQFLKEMEILIGADIYHFEGGKRFSDNHVYKYGIKEDAVLNYGQEA
jgi:hypothetical protein